MPSFCVVKGCPYQYQTTHSPSINFHRFPIAQDLLTRWKQFAEKPDSWQPTRESTICSNHFALTQFRNIKNNVLKSQAVPTIQTPVVEFNADEQTARSLERRRAREETYTRKPVFIHSSDLFPEHHKVQKKIKIPTEYQKEFPVTGYGSRCIKIPMEYEEDSHDEAQTVQRSKPISNDELFFSQFLQPAESSSSSHHEQNLKEQSVPVFQQNQEYDDTMEVLAEEGTTEVPEEYFEEVQETIHVIESYCRLCGGLDCEGLESFAENEDIIHTIHKCFPMLTIQPGDGLSSEICGTCLGAIQSFSQFSDEVISIQKQLEEKFLIKEVVAPEDRLKEESESQSAEDVEDFKKEETKHHQDEEPDSQIETKITSDPEKNEEPDSQIVNENQSSEEQFGKVVIQSLGDQKLYKIHIEESGSKEDKVKVYYFEIPEVKFDELKIDTDISNMEEESSSSCSSPSSSTSASSTSSSESSLNGSLKDISNIEDQKTFQNNFSGVNTKPDTTIEKENQNIDIPNAEHSKNTHKNIETFQETNKLVEISMNKPTLSEEFSIEIPLTKEEMSLFSVRKDCCHQCKLIFNNTLDYLRHKYNTHWENLKHPRSKYKSCLKCLRKLISSKALRNHKVVCSSRIRSYFECSRCSQGFNFYKKLKLHQKTCFVPLLIKQSSDLDKRTFACDMCDKRFSRKGGLTQHKNSYHFNIKPFVCRVCGYKYALKGDLQRCRHKKALLNGFTQN